MRVGVFPGKFLPPHRGHLLAILEAHSRCDKLYVVVSEQRELDTRLCELARIEFIPGNLRIRWLQDELEGLNIEFKLIDNPDLPTFPDGWNEYASELRAKINENIDVIFGGERSYIEGHKIAFPGVEYELVDPARSLVPISASEIRTNPIQYWDYLLDSESSFFARKILITGPESCGKSHMAKKLAIHFQTSCSLEYGHEYQLKRLAGNGAIFTDDDFLQIIAHQSLRDSKVISTANRLSIFDTDPVITAYYSQFYLGKVLPQIESYINPSGYDLVIALRPSVRWIDDGSRDTPSQQLRDKSFDDIMKLYEYYGFDINRFVIIESYNYLERFNQCRAAINALDGQRA
jgi:HTH-type transcriptional repressor of NAD biosynthesis genes